MSIWKKFTIICFVIFFAISISICLGHLLFYLLYYIHELGHGMFAVITNLLLFGKFSTFIFSRWSNGYLPTQLTPIFSIPVPITTHVSGNIWIIGIGGFLATTVFSLVISYFIFIKSNNPNKKIIFLFPLTVFVQDFMMNFVCGYDNATGIEFFFNQCPQLSVVIQIGTPFVFAILIFYFLFFEKIQRFAVSYSKNKEI